MHFPTILEISYRLPGGKRGQILRGRCSGAVRGRKRYHFLRGGCHGGIWSRKKHLFLRRMGYHPPAEQKNTQIPARRVPRRYLEQKKASIPARNGIPTACRAGKRLSAGAEGATEAFGAEKSIFSCAEWDTYRLPGRKTPQFLRGGCSEAALGRKKHLFLRGMGYQPPAGQENTQIPAREVPRRHLEQNKVSFSAQRGPQARQGPRGGECVKWYFSALYFVFVTKNAYICKIIFVNAQ